MGYTHYWYLDKDGDQTAYSNALVDIAAIVRASDVPLGDGWGKGVPVMDDSAILFNGSDPNDHETFRLYNRLQDLEAPESRSHGASWGKDLPWVFTCCKTAYKPYDKIVVACLCRLDEIGDGVRISSDGEVSDWEAGRRFAEIVLGRPIDIPRGVVKYVEA